MSDSASLFVAGVASGLVIGAIFYVIGLGFAAVRTFIVGDRGTID